MKQGMDHPPLMKESSPPHTHNVHMMENLEEGDHSHHHKTYGEHAAGHKKFHEHVKSMCGGGMAHGKK